MVHGKFNAVSFEKALKDAFPVSGDEKGKQLLASKKEMRDKVAECCVSCFKEKNYLVVLDDFEQNQEGYKEGNPGPLIMEAAVLLHTLLYYLPYSLKMAQLVITGRYKFKVSEGEKD